MAMMAANKQCGANIEELHTFILNRFPIHKSPKNEYSHFVNVYCFLYNDLPRQEAVANAQTAWKRVKETDSHSDTYKALDDVYGPALKKMTSLKSRPKHSIPSYFKKVLIPPV